MPVTGKARKISSQFRGKNSRENLKRPREREGMGKRELFAAVQPGINWPTAASESATSYSESPIQLEAVTYFLWGSSFSPEVQIRGTQSLYTGMGG